MYCIQYDEICKKHNFELKHDALGERVLPVENLYETRVPSRFCPERYPSSFSKSSS